MKIFRKISQREIILLVACFLAASPFIYYGYIKDFESTYPSSLPISASGRVDSNDLVSKILNSKAYYVDDFVDTKFTFDSGICISHKPIPGSSETDYVLRFIKRDQDKDLVTLEGEGITQTIDYKKALKILEHIELANKKKQSYYQHELERLRKEVNN